MFKSMKHYLIIFISLLLLLSCKSEPIFINPAQEDIGTKEHDQSFPPPPKLVVLIALDTDKGIITAKSFDSIADLDFLFTEHQLAKIENSDFFESSDLPFITYVNDILFAEENQESSLISSIVLIRGINLPYLGGGTWGCFKYCYSLPEEQIVPCLKKCEQKDKQQMNMQ